MKPSPPGRCPGDFLWLHARCGGGAASIGTSDQKKRKKFVKVPGKYLQSDKEYGIILRHDCTRYARMREVAALEAGKQGMKDAYEKSKTKTGLKWWERLLWVVLAGAAYAASALLGGCGHSVDVTPKKTVVCKDGSCLVLEPGHISYSQAQPETDVPPVVQSLKK